MHAINAQAKAIFCHLVEQTKQAKGHLKLNNNPVFMPLTVEYLNTVQNGHIYSLTHYYELNGDLMKDPDMTFLLCKETGEVYPLEYQQDNMGIYQTAVTFENFQVQFTKPRLQKSMADFANMWLSNIQMQQDLTIPTNE